MGRVTRWLRGLLGGKKKKNHPDKEEKQYGSIGGVEEVKREKKRWSFGKTGRSAGEGAPPRLKPSTPEETAWLHSLYAESEKEQSKRAIAVADATAAAADAAVAAAHAAAAVVRLASKGRSSAMSSIQERLAIVKIQSFFRAYLAKKALRALKALVKLQALIRGHLVRKHLAASLHKMQSQIRAQDTIRDHKSCRRRSLERFDDFASSSFHSRRLSVESSIFDRSPRIVEMDTYRTKSRSSRRTAVGDLLPPPGCVGSGGTRPTPARSAAAAAEGRSYMASTESFEAKVRERSAPRERPESPAARKRVPLSEVVVGSRPSDGMERSEASIGFKRMDGSLELEPCTAGTVYLHKW